MERIVLLIRIKLFLSDCNTFLFILVLAAHQNTVAIVGEDLFSPTEGKNARLLDGEASQLFQILQAAAPYLNMKGF